MRNLFVLFIMVCFVAACKQNYSDPEVEKQIANKRNFVEVVGISEQNDPIPIHAIGRIGADQEVKLSFKIGGFISGLQAKEGDFVKEGTLLGAVRTNEIDAQVLKAQRAVQKAERDVSRINKMFADSVATLENVEDLTTLLQVTMADLEVAEFNQKYAKIYAPVSGRISRRLAEPNELVAPGQPIFIISSAAGRSHVMKVALSDRDINRVKFGSQGKVYFDAYPEEEFGAKVVNLAENADPLTGTFEIELSIASKNKRLRNGYIGKAVITPNTGKSYYKIPLSAIVEGNEKGVSIFIPNQADTIAKEILVQPFHINSESIFVYLNEEMELANIITTGAQYLENGDRIYIK